MAPEDKYGRALSKDSRIRCYEAASAMLKNNKHITLSGALLEVLYDFGWTDVTDYDLYGLFPEYAQTLFRRYVMGIRRDQFLAREWSTHMGEMWLRSFGGIYTQIRYWYLDYCVECLRAELTK